MSDQGPSLADISRARNQKLGAESGLREESDKVAAQLKEAHLDAQRIKSTMGAIDAPKTTQAFPHGTPTSTPSSGQEGSTMSDKIRGAQEQLYSTAKDTATSVSDKAAQLGEAIKDTIAAADQGTTTRLRDGTAAAADNASKVASGVADTAGGLFDRAKDAVKGALGLSAGGTSPGTAGGGGGVGAAYEGVVFGSDDPDYSQQQGSGSKGIDSSTFPTTADVPIELGGATEAVSPAVEEGRPKTPATFEAKAPAAAAEAPAGAEGGAIKGSHTPALSLDELKGTSFKDTAGKPNNSSGSAPYAPPPVIASPKEGGSLGEGSVGVSAGDPAGGADVVAAARTAGRGILASVKDALGVGGSAAAPAGPPAADDPRTANVAVGDFKGLKEALEGSSSSSGGDGSSGGGSSGTADPSAAAINATVATDSSGASDIAPGVDSDALRQGLDEARGRVQQGLDSAAQAASDAAAGSSGGTGTGGGGFLSGLADIVSSIATKANIASSSEELMAGGVVPDEAAAPAAAAGDTAKAAPEAAATADAAADTAAAAKEAVTGSRDSSMSDRAADIAAASKDSAADTAAAAKEAVTGSRDSSISDRAADTAAAAKDSAADTATAAKSAAGDAASRVCEGAEHVKDTARDVAGRVAEGAEQATEQAKGVLADAAGAVASAMEVEGMGSGSGSDSAGDAGGVEASAGGGSPSADTKVNDQASSLLQDYKEGMSGAYDKAAGAASSAADAVMSAAASLTSSSGPQQQQQQDQQQQHVPKALEQQGRQTGAGFGTAIGSSGGAGVGGLKQAWEDLKHGGAKAPHATSVAGETAAPWDVTSNTERSKHLEDPHQAKLYEAEVYRVAPGSQQRAAGDSGSSVAAKEGAVAGAGRHVTGAVPHDKPDTSMVHKDQTNRFAGDKGIATGFGTGSAAGWDGDDSVKAAAAHFASSGSLGDMSAGQQLALIEAAQQAAAGVSVERAGSSAEGGVRSWVQSMSAVWSNFGRAAAGGPSGKDIPKDFFDNPTQDVVVDPVRGSVKVQGDSPGNKIMMRPADQIPTGGSANDPHLVAHKAERFGKVLKDTFTTSSEDAARDPDNLKGKSSDNKPDGTEYWLSHELDKVGSRLADTPAKAGAALGVAAEIGSGVAGHIKDKAAELVTNLGHGDIISQEERDARIKEGVDRVTASISNVTGGGGGGTFNAQELQEQRLAAAGDPALRRETLGDKVIGPLVSDVGDETRAREIASSYHKYKAEQEASGDADTRPDYAKGTSPAAASSSSSPSAAATPDSGTSSGSSGSGSGASDAARGVTKDVTSSVSDVIQEGKDTAKATGDVVSMEGRSAAEGAKGAAAGAADKAGSAVGSAVEGVKDTAREAADTAAATGEVAKMEVQAKVQGLKNAAQGVREEVGEVGDRAGQKVREGADAAAHGAGEVTGRTAEALDGARVAAGRAGEEAGSAAGGLLSSVGGAAKALLGGLLGPFEKEGAFDEATAVVTGPPNDFDPLPAEQLSGPESSAAEASRAHRDAAGDTGTAGAAAKTQSAPGGSSGTAAVGGSGGGSGGGGSGGGGSGRVGGSAAAPAGHEDCVQGMKTELQAGADDAARAAGLAAGHTEGGLEGLLGQVHEKVAAVQEKVSAVAQDWEVPPAEVPSNTEDLIRQKQAAQQQGQ